ncbi:Protein-tyrosine sulfotransferase A [Schistosoma japonicum]|nr:Protein-tyrosine sulfotransferase A [Schistosoma japonicum]KAH8877480.1 Protein-tyrosine sulfotransferase A [Schistosoma japonicum]
MRMIVRKSTKIALRRTSSLYVILLLFFIVLFYFFITKRAMSSLSDKPRQIIFIGGYPRSGTTLMRVLLDVHPMIRCGPETRVIPKLLNLRGQWGTGKESERLKAAGLYPDVIDSAVRSFILSLIINAGETSPVLCNKDPLSFIHLEYMAKIFPDAKFIHMVRDGRAVINSLVKRNVTIRGAPKEIDDRFLAWEIRVSQFIEACNAIGSTRCMTIKYESLVLQPTEVLQTLFKFLDLPWDPVVLHHEKAMNRNALSKFEPSTSQVVHPIHLASLTSWASNESALPESFISSIHRESNVLQTLGYAELGVPPNYGTPENQVANITDYLNHIPQFRQIF